MDDRLPATPMQRVTAARLGLFSGAATALLCAVYVVVLAIGLATLPSPAHPIQPPWFTLMELLILAIAPAMVLLMVALHSEVAVEHKPWAFAAVVFMAMMATVTCSVHFAILTLSRLPAFAAAPWQPWVFSFTWPSVVYSLDILAWDVFFPLSALCAALALPGERWIRFLLLASAALAFAGLAGIPFANMQVRNIGIVGYTVLFPTAAAMLAWHFQRNVQPDRT